MVDFLSPAGRSVRMSRIRDKDTRPGLALRSALHRLGLRYRLHDRSLPGKPDLVFRRRKVVVFVHGCFWHRHQGCTVATIPKSNADFWREKFARNVRRDGSNRRALETMGWRVLVAWECQLSSRVKLEKEALRLFRLLS